MGTCRRSSLRWSQTSRRLRARWTLMTLTLRRPTLPLLSASCCPRSSRPFLCSSDAQNRNVFFVFLFSFAFCSFRVFEFGWLRVLLLDSRKPLGCARIYVFDFDLFLFLVFLHLQPPSSIASDQPSIVTASTF